MGIYGLRCKLASLGITAILRYDGRETTLSLLFVSVWFLFFCFFFLLQIVAKKRLQAARLENGVEVAEGPGGMQEEEDLLEL